MRLSYVSAEKFTIVVINSLRLNRMIIFRDRFHTVDVLLVDDIQFIAGKERRKKSFFILSMRSTTAKTDVISRTACRRTQLHRRAGCAHGSSGIDRDIQPPTSKPRSPFCRKSGKRTFSLPDDVAEIHRRGHQVNVRELEGALTRLMA